MGQNFIAISAFAGIIHSVRKSIKLRLKERDKNPMENEARFELEETISFLTV